MIDSSQVDKLQALVGRRLNGNRHQNNSTASSVHSNNSFAPNSSLYASSIEKQLQSLVGVDTLQDTTQVLQQTFDQLEIDSGNHSNRSSLKRPLSSFTITTDLGNDLHRDDENSVSGKKRSFFLCTKKSIDASIN